MLWLIVCTTKYFCFTKTQGGHSRNLAFNNSLRQSPLLYSHREATIYSQFYTRMHLIQSCIQCGEWFQTHTYTHTYTLTTPTETCQPTERVLIDWLACKCFAALDPGQDTQSNAMLDPRCRRVPEFGFVSREALSIMLFIYTHETVVAPCDIPPTYALVRSTLRSFPTLIYMWADSSFLWPFFQHKNCRWSF